MRMVRDLHVGALAAGKNPKTHRFTKIMPQIKGERGKAWKGEDPQENWEKGQVLWICRGVGVVPSRVIRDEYRI